MCGVIHEELAKPIDAIADFERALGLLADAPKNDRFAPLLTALARTRPVRA